MNKAKEIAKKVVKAVAWGLDKTGNGLKTSAQLIRGDKKITVVAVEKKAIVAE